MASDLAATPRSGVTVQLCGNAHFSNFGVFASPERQLMFDLNDFDETLPGPWEWDVKRLAASFEVASAPAAAQETSRPFTLVLKLLRTSSWVRAPPCGLSLRFAKSLVWEPDASLAVERTWAQSLFLGPRSTATWMGSSGSSLG